MRGEFGHLVFFFDRSSSDRNIKGTQLHKWSRERVVGLIRRPLEWFRVHSLLI
jgi:hypothetical protein